MAAVAGAMAAVAGATAAVAVVTAAAADEVTCRLSGAGDSRLTGLEAVRRDRFCGLRNRGVVSRPGGVATPTEPPPPALANSRFPQPSRDARGTAPPDARAAGRERSDTA